MYRSKYFTLYEMTWSETAYKSKIKNEPGPEELEHIKELLPILDSLREKWGKPIRITSGYRNPQINALVGGVKNSAHLTGYAVDVKPFNNDMDGFMKVAREWVKTLDGYDEFLEEYGNGGGHWLHFSLKSIKGLQRGKNGIIDKRKK